MASPEALLDRLRSYARRWGGDIVASRQRADLNAPFAKHVGLNYTTKQVFYDPDAIPAVHSPSLLIHEMGHVFACRRAPHSADEFGFLGWEYVLARRTGMVRAWLKGSARYGIPGWKISGTDSYAVELQDLKGRDLSRFLASRVRAAARLGLIREGRPVARR